MKTPIPSLIKGSQVGFRSTGYKAVVDTAQRLKQARGRRLNAHSLMHSLTSRVGLSHVCKMVLLAGAFMLMLAPAPVLAQARFATCDGKPAGIVGDNFPNRLSGTSGDDVIVGLGGNDTIIGRGGNDAICGNVGRDFLRGGGSRDRLFGGVGPDKLIGDPGKDRLFGEDGNDTLDGVDAKGGNDTLDGGPGTDVCNIDGCISERSTDSPDLTPMTHPQFDPVDQKKPAASPEDHIFECEEINRKDPTPGTDNDCLTADANNPS